MKTIALAALMMLSVPLAMAKEKETVSVTPVSEDADAANGGVLFALPQTVVRVKLTAQVVVSSAGPFFKYSTRYLGLRDVVTSNSTKWTLIGADVETVGVADPSRRYKLSASSANAMPSVSMTNEGVVVAFNSEASAPVASEDAQGATPNLSYANFEDVQLPQSVLARTSTAAMAEECANAIYNLRSTRLDLLAGAKEAQLPDAGAYARVLDDIDRQERAHVQLFAGRRDTFIVVRTVDLIPEEGSTSPLVPVRFSESAGFVDALDLNGLPVYVDMKFEAKSQVNAYAPGSKQRKAAPVSGLRYLLSSSLSVSVSDRNIPLCSKTVRCSQGAQEASLPADFLVSHTVVLDPATGALVSLTKK